MKIDGELLKKRKENLAKAIEYHGHLCLGQILGVHIAETGLKAIGTIDTKKIIVYVEIDRCLADAIQIITGTRLGRRSMKHVNYEKLLEVPSEEIVSIQKVIVNIPKEEMPGKPLRTVFCVNCNEKIFDGKEIPGEKGPLCKACSDKPYYIVGENN